MTNDIERKKLKASYMREWVAKNPEKVRALTAASTARRKAQFASMTSEEQAAERKKRAEYMRARRAARPDVRAKNIEDIKKWNAANPQHRWYLAKKSRSKKEGVEFTIKRDDLLCPEQCPVLGIALLYGSQGLGKCCDASASMDRIDPAKGYVAGNVLVVSHKANSIRRNASPEDILKVGLFYQKLLT